MSVWVFLVNFGEIFCVNCVNRRVLMDGFAKNFFSKAV